MKSHDVIAPGCGTAGPMNSLIILILFRQFRRVIMASVIKVRVITCVIPRKLKNTVGVEPFLPQADCAVSCRELPNHTAQGVVKRAARTLKKDDKYKSVCFVVIEWWLVVTSETFEPYLWGHVKRIIGSLVIALAVIIGADKVLRYEQRCLGELQGDIKKKKTALVHYIFFS